MFPALSRRRAGIYTPIDSWGEKIVAIKGDAPDAIRTYDRAFPVWAANRGTLPQTARMAYGIPTSAGVSHAMKVQPVGLKPRADKRTGPLK